MWLVMSEVPSFVPDGIAIELPATEGGQSILRSGRYKGASETITGAKSRITGQP